MDSKTARFMRVKRYSREELDRIHAVERAADEKWRLNSGRRRGIPYFLEASVELFDDFDVRHGSYWQKGRAEDEKALAVKEFARRIFPIWAGIFTRSSMGEFSELEAYHKSDDVIWSAQISVDVNAPLSGKAGRVRELLK